MNVLTHEVAKALRDRVNANDPLELIRATEQAVLSKLAAGVSVEPAYKAKPYSSLPTVVVSAQVDYYSRDQLTTAIAAARVAALEEAAKVCDRQAIPNAGFLAEKVRALINAGDKQ